MSSVVQIPTWITPLNAKTFLSFLVICRYLNLLDKVGVSWCMNNPVHLCHTGEVSLQSSMFIPYTKLHAGNPSYPCEEFFKDREKGKKEIQRKNRNKSHLVLPVKPLVPPALECLPITVSYFAWIYQNNQHEFDLPVNGLRYPGYNTCFFP